MAKTSYTRRLSFAAALLVLAAALHPANAQCDGVYFKTGHRAVNETYFNQGHSPLNDWTGDGKSDFWNFETNTSTNTRNIKIYPSSPAGFWNWDGPIVFTTPIPSNVSTNNRFIVVKDLDADGLIDIFVGDRIYHNNGNSTLSERPQVVFPGTVGIDVAFTTFLNINGDAFPDLVYIYTSTPAGWEMRYHAGSASGEFGPPILIFANTPGSGFTGSRPIFGDFTGDGKADFIYVVRTGYRMLRNAGDGTFTADAPGTLNNRVGEHEVRDLNNDGRDDIVVSHQDTLRLVTLITQANGSFVETLQPSSEFSRYKTADMNGDHFLDIVEYGDQYAIHTNDGTGGFVRRLYEKPLPSNAAPRFEDFSGDGKADYFDDSRQTINAFGEQVVIIKVNTCQFPGGETKRPNFDGDRTSDVVVWDGSTGKWSAANAWWSNAPFINIPQPVINWGSAALGDVPAPGDYDGDGKTDRAVFRSSSGVWYILRSSDSGSTAFQFGLDGDIAVPADYNGGGSTDIAVFRPSNGTWYIWYTEDQQFGALHFGASGDKPVYEDYDGDGKTDPAVYRPSDGTWYYTRSSDGSWDGKRWGISTDKPVPGDYDGDGKSDFAVYRDGIWYLLGSSNGTAAYIHWGNSEFTPMPYYRNGDIAEMIAFRAASFGWYNYRYSDSTPVVFWGENPSVPVKFGLPNN